MSFTTPPPEVPRDGYGRPLVIPPTGGKPVPYTRCTTFVGAIEDTYTLGLWQQRMVALGLADRPDLLMAVVAHRDQKGRLNAICKDAQEAAKAHAAATTGTALHALTERIDRGLTLGVIPEAYQADLDAYVRATARLKPVMIEQFCVQDPLKVGGTPDRVVEYKGKRYIADLKTGTLTFGFVKIAAQLAVYARSRPYNVETGERTAHGAEVDRGIIIHAPAGSGTCTLYWVDLLAGWEAVKVSKAVREKRALKLGAVVHDFDADWTPSLGAAKPAAAEEPGVTTAFAVTPAEPEPPTLAQQIDLCRNTDELRALWTANTAVWTPEHTELATARMSSFLNAATTNTGAHA